MPTGNESLHVDRYLTNISVDFVQDNEDFVSDKVFPVVPVQKKSDEYVIYDRGYFWRNEMGPRPMGGRADTADWDFTTGTYLAEERALSHRIDDRQRANADEPLDLDEQGARLLQTQVAIDNDKRWASNYFTTGVWTTDEDGSGSDFTQFDDSSSTPIQYVDSKSEEIKKLTGVRPNTIVAGAKTWRALKNNSNIKELVKYGSSLDRPAILNRDILARVFGVDQFLVASGLENTADEGQTDSLDWIASEDAMLLTYAAPTAGLNVPSGGYTFAWTNLVDGAANLMGSAIMRGRDEFAHSDYLEIRSATDIKLVAADLGIFMQNAVSSSF